MSPVPDRITASSSETSSSLEMEASLERSFLETRGLLMMNWAAGTKEMEENVISTMTEVSAF